jgi:small-conductance mechanosensitive channel
MSFLVFFLCVLIRTYINWKNESVYLHFSFAGFIHICTTSLLVTGATLASLVAFGFNIRPLLTLGSVSTLAIGFAAQSTVANIVSALSLYTSRPFIRGDQIILQTMSGSTVVKGTVEQILPMQTIITTDAGHPLFVHNKDIVSSYLIINTSRQKQASAKSSAQHALDTTITVRYCDVDATLPIMKEITRVLKTNPNLRQDVSCGCSLKEFSLLGPVLSIKCTLNRDAASRKSLEFAGIMLEAERVVRKHGAFLATQEVVPLPPTLVEEGTAT